MATIRVTAAAAALVLSAALGAAETRPPAAPAAQALESEAAGSVAVLPFTNITGLTVDDWYGVGIVETLAAALEGTGLPVMRGESAAAADVVAAGRALGTRWVVVGSYQRQAGQLRIAARVVDVATGAVVRTSIVDGAVADLFDLQDRLAADLQPVLAEPARPEPPRAPPAAAAAPAPAEAGERRCRDRLRHRSAGHRRCSSGARSTRDHQPRRQRPGHPARGAARGAAARRRRARRGRV